MRVVRDKQYRHPGSRSEAAYRLAVADAVRVLLEKLFE